MHELDIITNIDFELVDKVIDLLTTEGSHKEKQELFATVRRPLLCVCQETVNEVRDKLLISLCNHFKICV